MRSFFSEAIFLPILFLVTFVYIVALLVGSNSIFAQAPVSQTFSCTGAPQTFTVPCTDSITVKAWGGGGGGGGSDAGYGPGGGGGGAFSTSVIPVTSGDILTIMVGCGGSTGVGGSGSGGGIGGYGSGSGGNGGNPGPSGGSGGGGGGGGGTGLWFGGTVLLVAGGGGGSGGAGQYGGGGSGGGGGVNGTVGSGTGNDASFGVAGASGSGNGINGASHGADGGGGGGGGGGLNGGGGGSITCDCGGGGGGGGTSMGTTVINGSGQTPGNSADPDLCAGCATGGMAVAGGNGLMIITYTPLSVAPQAIFSTGSTCFNTPPTQFTNSSVGATSYSWDFGDPSSPDNTSTLQNPSHIYTSPGSFTATLTVANVSCTHTTTQTVTINPAPVADFSASTVCSGNATVFTNTSAGSNLQWSWNFGDGSGTSNAIDPNYQYAAYGTYPVQLIATTDSGCTDTALQTIQVHAMPNAAFSASNVCAYDSVQFANMSTIGSGIITYLWDFGDGNNSTLQFPAHLYGSAGSFNAGLVVSSDSGCVDSASQIIYINPVPVAAFSAGNNCLFDNSFFNNASTISSGAIAGWNWTFGDGIGTSSIQNPNYQYSNDGAYSVQLIATSDSGCADTISQTILINDMPDAAFSTSNVCEYDSAMFFDNTTISSGNISWSWDFGDGSVSTLQNPTHLYGTNGSYNVQLISTSDSGCSDTVSQVLIVHPKPNALFSANTICHFDTAFFIDSSAIVNGSIVSWIWDFGDGGSSFAQNPFHLYNTDGVHPVTLIVISDSGCSDTVSAGITVFPAPQAIFTTNNVCIYDSVYFVNNSTVTSGGIFYSWDLGDGTVSVQQNPVHLYSTNGNYSVSLAVSSDSGCADTLSLLVWVNPAPNTSFTSNNNCLYDTSFFNNTSNIAAGTISLWNWDFGDGANSSAASPFHIYSAAGIYTVTLIATSDSGCTDTTILGIEKYPVPVASFTPDTVCFKDSTQFGDLSTISGGSIVSWVWNFGDGTPNVYIQNPYHYFALGYYNVTLLAISDKGCLDDSTKQVGVHPLPVAAFNYGNGCINEQPAKFSDSSTVSNATIVSWQWDFGDGATSALENPAHSYNSAGTFDVELVVFSSKGCSDTLQQPIRIFPVPQVDFSINDSDGCQPFCIDFSDGTVISQDTLSIWQWDFGNGTTSGLQNPSYCYINDGSYSITLIVTSNQGCKDTLIKNDLVEVFPLPVADFSFSPTQSNIQDMNVFFTDLSTGDLAQWNWTFYDNDEISILDSSSVQNSTFNFATEPDNPFIFFLEDTGFYWAQLITITVNGCSDTIKKSVWFEGVFYVNLPNSFSPNGDGINEYFFPYGIGIEPYKDYNFYIFNRWGQLIFESHNLDSPWDGTLNGQALQQDVYVWTLELREATEKHKKREYIGHVTLIR